MIKDEFIKQAANDAHLVSIPYTEVYDLEGLRDLKAMAERYMSDEYELPRANGMSVPDGSYSDFSCHVWNLFTEAVEYGVKIGLTVATNRLHAFVNKVCPSSEN